MYKIGKGFIQTKIDFFEMDDVYNVSKRYNQYNTSVITLINNQNSFTLLSV